MKPAHTHRIPEDHPAFAGHFPGAPILPGALLLDEALAAVVSDLELDIGEWQVATAKFFEPVRPGDEITVEHSGAAELCASGAAAWRVGDRIAFSVRVAARPILAGTLSRRAAGADDDA
jgi:3-hydroxyacyl-[acyl-carrier-protein] dehydratase